MALSRVGAPLGEWSEIQRNTPKATLQASGWRFFELSPTRRLEPAPRQDFMALLNITPLAGWPQPCGSSRRRRRSLAPSRPAPRQRPGRRPAARPTTRPRRRAPTGGSQKETPDLAGPASQRTGSQSGPREPDPLAIWKTPGPIGPWALTPCRPKSAEFQGARFAPRRFRRTRSRRASCWRLWRRFSTPRREWSS